MGIDVVAEQPNQVGDFYGVVQHVLVVVVHLLEQVDEPNVLAEVVHHLGQKSQQFGLHFLVVFNQSHQQFVAHVQQFGGQLLFWDLLAVRDVAHHLIVDIGSIHQFLLHQVGRLALIGEIYEMVGAHDLEEAGLIESGNVLQVGKVIFIFHQLVHHVHVLD